MPCGILTLCSFQVQSLPHFLTTNPHWGKAWHTTLKLFSLVYYFCCEILCFGQDVSPKFWEMQSGRCIFSLKRLCARTESFWGEQCWGLQPRTPVPLCQDWSLCLKEAFLAAQKELLDFAAREGWILRDDMGWPWMTYASFAKKWRRRHPYYIILLIYQLI